mgnify:CR=1 FL=1
MPINKRRAQRISAPAFPNELLHDFKVPHVHFIGAPLLLVIHLARQPHPRLRRYPIGTKDPLTDFYRYLSGIILKYILVFAEAFQNIPFQRTGGIIKGILYQRIRQEWYMVPQSQRKREMPTLKQAAKL